MLLEAESPEVLPFQEVFDAVGSAVAFSSQLYWRVGRSFPCELGSPITELVDFYSEMMDLGCLIFDYFCCIIKNFKDLFYVYGCFAFTYIYIPGTLRDQKRVSHSFEAGVKDGCEQPGGCWELNLAPLQPVPYSFQRSLLV